MTRYRVKTLDQAALKADSRALFAQASGFAPDIVIGIKTGGYTVAALMFDAGPSMPVLLPITSQRAGTAKKSRSFFFAYVVRHLPRWLNNQLRLIEHARILHRNRDLDFVECTLDEAELQAIEQALALKPDARVLIVDDACDTGSTMLAVAAKLQSMAPNAMLKTAAITVTMPSPRIEPDYRVYHYVLCRFPWSFDF
jgi:hypoxanthine phosphoribosyltransferase